VANEHNILLYTRLPGRQCTLTLAGKKKINKKGFLFYVFHFRKVFNDNIPTLEMYARKYRMPF